MSRLSFNGRPWVAFNPALKRHREWYNEFQVHGTWGHCPVRFIVDDEAQGNLVTMIQRKLVKYYVGKEFKSEEIECLSTTI